MGPSITIGAVILLRRKAPTKVSVFHAPSGTEPITRTPLGARPRSRTRLVLTAVSSRNTSRDGSSAPCSRIQRRRALATSGRCRSVACRLFFKGDAVSFEKPKERATADAYPLLTQHGNHLVQSQIRPLGTDRENLVGELLQRGTASTSRLGRGASLLAPTLYPLNCRRHAYPENLRGLASRRASFHRFDNTLPHVTRIGPCFHGSPPKRITAKSLYPW